MSEKKSYKEKLKDPRWQKKRLIIMERDRFQCSSCGDDSKTLNVHHCVYVNTNDPWDYPDNLLITLCEDCHNFEHSGQRDLEIKDLLEELKGNGVLLADISNLIESLAEQKYSRSKIARLVNHIYSDEKHRQLNNLEEIKLFIEATTE